MLEYACWNEEHVCDDVVKSCELNQYSTISRYSRCEGIPRAVKANVGHQIATTLEKYSRAEKARKHAKQTSQFAPIPVMK
jgi:hypothetical protein